MDLSGFNRRSVLLSQDEDFLNTLSCTLCHDILLKPVSCLNGHNFCLHCITTAVAVNKKYPGGCGALFPSKPVPNLIAVNLVDRLECRCGNGPVSHIEDDNKEQVDEEQTTAGQGAFAPALKAKKLTRLSRAPYRPLHLRDDEAMEQDIDRMVSSASHESPLVGPPSKKRRDDSPSRLYRLVGGSSSTVAEAAAAVAAVAIATGRGNSHRLVCPKRKVPCPHCKISMAFDSLQGHLEGCLEMHIDCPFAFMGCRATLARKSMLAHFTANAAQHATLPHDYQRVAVPSATIELTIKNVQQKIEGKTTVGSDDVPFPLVGFSKGQVHLEVRFGGPRDGVEGDDKTLAVYAHFTCPGAPAVEPPPEICFQGTTFTLMSQDGAVKNVEMRMASPHDKARLGYGWGRREFCKDVTPFIKDDTIVVRATIRARPATPAAPTIKHTVA